ncbi:MAG: response regulator [Cyanobacteria bacterium P01_G01_bin.19]
MKILLVEDDKIIAQTLVKILRDRHYIVDLAAEGDLGWEMVEAYDYDLIVLDIVLPKLDGIEFCQKLRLAGNQTPVLLLTAQNSHDKKVTGLDAGADDYVVKPFEINELLARIRVLLRRRSSLASPILRWGKLSLNSSTHRVVYDQHIINLTPKEYCLLELFLHSGDRVMTRDIILDRLWDVEEAPNENTVTAHIKDLRRKLKQVGADPNLIETVYGVGYRLKPPSKSSDIETAPTLPKQKINVDRNEAKTINRRQKTQSALAEVWQQYEQTYKERLTILERANRAWQAGMLKGQLLRQARGAAHKLAGSLGIFGFSQGSNLALEMEQLLSIELEVNRSKRFADLLRALKQVIKPNLQFKPNSIHCNRPLILAVDDQPKLVGQLIDEMTAIGMTFDRISQPKQLKQALQTSLNAIILELSLADCHPSTLDKFASIVKGKIPLSVILFSDRSRQRDRLKIARLGGHVLLQKASLDRQTTAKIVKALQQSQHKTAKVLAVDDDPQILTAIANLLDPLTIDLTILDNPLNFWQTIADLKPDLLILDVSMPHFTGIELCQLLRNDLRWRELPILFFTAYDDLNTVHQILTAGADDYISKVIAPSELAPKIFNHLNRGQLLTSLAK